MIGPGVCLQEVIALANEPMRPCRHPGCHALTVSGYCDKHKPRGDRGGEVSKSWRWMYGTDVWLKDLRPMQELMPAALVQRMRQARRAYQSHGCGPHRGSPRGPGAVHRSRQPAELVPQLPWPQKLRRKFTGGAAKTAERLGAPAWLPLRTGACGDLYRPPPGQKCFETDDAKPRGLLRAGFFPHGLRAAGKNPTSWGKQEESSTIIRRRISPGPPGRSANRGCAPPYPAPARPRGRGMRRQYVHCGRLSELPYQ